MTSLADRQLEQWKVRMSALGRLPKEWVGKTPESMPPPTVRDRILRAHRNICHISGIEIRPGMSWQADHIIPLANQGMNAERNLAPAIDAAHREKTAQENAERAKIAAKRRAVLGIKPEGAFALHGREFPKFSKQSRIGKVRIDKSALPPLPRRGLT